MMLDGWTKKDGVLRLDAHSDVDVRFVADMEGQPFQGTVGSAIGQFDFLQDAIDWCVQVAEGRAIMEGSGPLALPKPNDKAFLDEKGLNG